MDLLHKINVDHKLYCIKIYRNCIERRQNDDKSKKMSKTLQKFDFGMEPKVTTLLPT